MLSTEQQQQQRHGDNVFEDKKSRRMRRIERMNGIVDSWLPFFKAGERRMGGDCDCTPSL